MKRLLRVIGAIALLSLFLVRTTIPTQAQGIPFDKANFHNPLKITNPYMPLVAGTTYIYAGMTEGEPSHEQFIVTNQTKTILGVETRVIHDIVWENGKLVEDTFDWHAQDDAGNVWYLGEDSTQYEDGKVVGHEGSWEAGVKGASAGIVMGAHPKVGDTLQQEFAPGIAEDKSTVLSLTKSIVVTFGPYSPVMQTKEFTPLEPDVVENKYYAKGIGQIKEVMVKGGSEESELVDILKK